MSVIVIITGRVTILKNLEQILEPHEGCPEGEAVGVAVRCESDEDLQDGTVLVKQLWVGYPIFRCRVSSSAPQKTMKFLACQFPQ